MQSDVCIAVERVYGGGATVAIAMASAAHGAFADRGEAVFADQELRLPLTAGGHVAMRLRADRNMELSVWAAGAPLLSVGVLTQKPLASIYTRTVERLPTPWRDEDGALQTLEMVVYRPPGEGPFPTLIFNHGSTGSGDKPEWFKFTWTSPEVARYFTERGWQVLFPQRRGRGKSGGLYDEGFNFDRAAGYSGEPDIAVAGFDRAVSDLDVVTAQVLTRPDVDQKRLIIGGVSRGGILAVAYAGMRPELFRGVVNIVGGWLGDICAQSAEVNMSLMRRGARFTQQMLWLYGKEDPYYKIVHSRTVFDAFTAAGGSGQFVAIDPPPGRDGHSIHLKPSMWAINVERYLNDIENAS